MWTLLFSLLPFLFICLFTFFLSLCKADYGEKEHRDTSL